MKEKKLKIKQNVIKNIPVLNTRAIFKFVFFKCQWKFMSEAAEKKLVDHDLREYFIQ